MNETYDVMSDFDRSRIGIDKKVSVMVRKSKDDCFNVLPQADRQVWMGCDVIGCPFGAARNKHPPLTPEGVRYCTSHYIAWRKISLEGELKEYYDSIREELINNEYRRNNTLNRSG